MATGTIPIQASSGSLGAVKEKSMPSSIVYVDLEVVIVAFLATMPSDEVGLAGCWGLVEISKSKRCLSLYPPSLKTRMLHLPADCPGKVALLTSISLSQRQRPPWSQSASQRGCNRFATYVARKKSKHDGCGTRNPPPHHKAHRPRHPHHQKPPTESHER